MEGNDTDSFHDYRRCSLIGVTSTYWICPQPILAPAASVLLGIPLSFPIAHKKHQDSIPIACVSNEMLRRKSRKSREVRRIRRSMVLSLSRNHVINRHVPCMTLRSLTITTERNCTCRSREIFGSSTSLVRPLQSDMTSSLSQFMTASKHCLPGRLCRLQ